MKPIIFVILLFAFTAPSQAVQKCTDSDGRITYADFCPASGPAKVESLYIPDTYDAEADRQAQINALEMEQRTRQSAYERHQRNAGNRQRGTAAASSYDDRAELRREANKHFDEATKILKNLPYGTPGDRAKRESMLDHASILQDIGRAKMGQNAIQSPAKEYRRSAATASRPAEYDAPQAGMASEYKYRSYTGQEYKYDLNQPLDRLQYQTDPLSQLRDSINPRVDIDRGLGQYGGGAK